MEEKITIDENEISDYIRNIYTIVGSNVIGKSNPFNGERAFGDYEEKSVNNNLL